MEVSQRSSPWMSYWPMWWFTVLHGGLTEVQLVNINTTASGIGLQMPYWKCYQLYFQMFLNYSLLWNLVGCGIKLQQSFTPPPFFYSSIMTLGAWNEKHVCMILFPKCFWLYQLFATRPRQQKPRAPLMPILMTPRMYRAIPHWSVKWVSLRDHFKC